MSNLANYSPYNKTYKFLLYQNQAYHERNKRNAKPCVRTNLRYVPKNINDISSPESPTALFRSSNGFDKPMSSSSNRCESQKVSMARSQLFSSDGRRNYSPEIHKQKRVIHKHASFEKFSKKKIQAENSELVQRLINASCQVIKNKRSLKHFQNHLRYRQIRNKYDSQGKRKHSLALGNSKLLCPTLKQYNESGLGSKFLELDLSMVSQTSSPLSLRKRASNFSCQP